MYKTFIARCVITLALAVLLMGAKCPGVPETNEIELTVVTQTNTTIDFLARGSLNYERSTEVVNIDELRRDIEDAEIDVDDLESIKVSMIEYGIAAYGEPVNDRAIQDAVITVRQAGGGDAKVLIQDLDEPDIYAL
jgi:hypothetical protein